MNTNLLDMSGYDYSLIPNNDGSYTLKLGITYGCTPYNITREPTGTITINKKVDTILVCDNYNILNFLQLENITVKNIIKAVIHKDNDIHNYKDLNTPTLLKNIYTLIGNNITIIRNSQLEMKIGQSSGDEYTFIENLGISIVNNNMNKCIEEIFNQCIKINYKFSIKIEFNSGRIITFERL
jgi:hypothetical protein